MIRRRLEILRDNRPAPAGIQARRALQMFFAIGISSFLILSDSG